MSATRQHAVTRHGGRRRRRRWGWGALIAAGILLILGVLAVAPALGVRARLLTGRDELEDARDLLLPGEVPAAPPASAPGASERGGPPPPWPGRCRVSWEPRGSADISSRRRTRQSSAVPGDSWARTR